MATHLKPRASSTQAAPGGGRTSVAGLVTAAVLFVVLTTTGLVVFTMQPPRWSARASVLVLPVANPDQVAIAGYYETLSRGQMVATFAEVARLQRVKDEAAVLLGLPEAELADVAVSVEVVPETALFTITATSALPQRSEAMADAVLSVSTDRLAALGTPFRALLVSAASGTAQRIGLARGQFLMIVVLCAAVAAVAAQQAVQHLQAALAPRRRGAAAPAVSVSSDPVTTPGDWSITFPQHYPPQEPPHDPLFSSPSLPAEGERSVNGEGAAGRADRWKPKDAQQ